MEQIKSGKLQALAVTTAKRSEALPNVPVVSEFVAGYEASGWNGLCAPKNTPVEIVEKLNSAIKASLADPKYESTICRPGRCDDSRIARRIRRTHCFRDRKVGESDPRG